MAIPILVEYSELAATFNFLILFSLRNSVWPRTWYIAKAVLELQVFLSLLSSAGIVGLSSSCFCLGSYWSQLVSCLHRLSHSTCTGWNHSVQTKLPLLQSQTPETPRNVFMLSGWITWNPSSLQGLDFPGFYLNAVSIHWKALSLLQVFGYWVEELQSTREAWDKRTCQPSPHGTVV